MAYDGRTCLDSPARKKDLRKAVGLYPCHNQGGNQVKIKRFLGKCEYFTTMNLPLTNDFSLSSAILLIFFFFNLFSFLFSQIIF